jgi:Neuraminidase (sialidase)
MKSPLLLLLVAILALAARAEPENRVTLNIESTPAHPRNSEGAFATLRSGRVVFYFCQFYGGSSDSDRDRVMEVHSDDQGRTWSDARPVFAPGDALSLMDLSLLRLQDGRLAFFYGRKQTYQDCRPFVRFSSDEGASWTAPQPLTDAPGYFPLHNDRVLQTASGRIILPTGFNRSRNAHLDISSMDDRGIVLWYYSDDAGASWKEAATWWGAPFASPNGLQEPGAVALADGSLYSWARTDNGTQYEFRSRDNGETWSAPVPGNLVSSLGPASIKRLPHSPALLAVYNDRSAFPVVLDGGKTHRFVRTPLTVAVSSDGGRTWPFKKNIETDPQGQFCYTAIHFTDDAVLLGYSAGAAHGAHLGRLRIRRLALANFPKAP